MSRIASLLLLALAAHAVEAADPHAALVFGTRGAAETVVRRTPLEVGQNRHGEFVLLRRGDALVARTTLCSALLGRGLQSIRRKERARWPEGTEGHEDSERYLRALDAAEDAARAAWLERTNVNDDRRKMMIELVQDDGHAFFATYAIDAKQDGATFDVSAATVVVLQDASPRYIAGAMRTQAENAFKIGGEELERLFAPR